MNTKGIALNKKTGIVHAIRSQGPGKLVSVCDVILDDVQLIYHDNSYDRVTCRKCLAKITHNKLNHHPKSIAIVDKISGCGRVFDEGDYAGMMAFLKTGASDREIVDELAKHVVESRYAIIVGDPMAIVPEVETIIELKGISLAEIKPENI